MPYKLYRQFLNWLLKFRLFSIVNNGTINLLKYLPVSSEIIGAPKGFYNTTLDWVNASKSRQYSSAVNYVEIEQAQTVDRSQPKSIERELHWKFCRIYSKHILSSSMFVVTVPHGRVWSDSAIISKDDRLLKDLSVEIGKTPETFDQHSIFQKWKLRSAHYFSGKAAVLNAPGGLNYCHWMFDVLPRLELIRLSGQSLDSIDHFIVNSCHLAFQQETLTYLGIPKTKIIESEQYGHIKANQLIVPSLLRGYSTVGSMIDQFACDFLRNKFLVDSVVNTVSGTERIYITRSGCSYRQVINETELVDFLSTLGFKVIKLESMSVAEQISTFAQAKIIVAPHGAGLSNIAFCAPNTKLVELFSPNYVNVCFWGISNYINIDYYYLIGEGDRPSDYVDTPIPDPHTDNILVNLKDLSKLLELACIN